VTPLQRELILSLVIGPGDDKKRDLESFLGAFGEQDGTRLGLELLADAANRRDPRDLELALIVIDVFGVAEAHREVLSSLVRSDWHVKHEDIVSLLGRLGSPESVADLVFATSWVPEYLSYDENRALARKAIHALGNIPGPEVDGALAQLLSSPDDLVRRQAARALEKRRDVGGRKT